MLPVEVSARSAVMFPRRWRELIFIVSLTARGLAEGSVDIGLQILGLGERKSGRMASIND
jgi:hypothetical protein